MCYTLKLVHEEQGIQDICFPMVEIKDSNVTIDWRNLFDQSVNNNITRHDKITKAAIGKGDSFTTRFLLDYLYFKGY